MERACGARAFGFDRAAAAFLCWLKSLCWASSEFNPLRWRNEAAGFTRPVARAPPRTTERLLLLLGCWIAGPPSSSSSSSSRVRGAASGGGAAERASRAEAERRLLRSSAENMPHAVTMRARRREHDTARVDENGSLFPLLPPFPSNLHVSGRRRPTGNITAFSPIRPSTWNRGGQGYVWETVNTHRMGGVTP